MSPIVKVVKPSGILDNLTTQKLRQDIDDLLSSGANTILVDFQDVTFMNSSGLGALVAILKNVRAQNAQLFLCSLSEQVKMIFALTKMDRIFQICENPSDFEQKVNKIN